MLKYLHNIKINCFDRDNVIKFSNFLFDKFNIKSTVHKNSVLYFSRQSTEIITNILKKYPVDGLQYKLIV